ncbi:pyruvate dehydrogenase (acetyl-transferring) E1 component subunit alpha [Actinobacteria bacterium YIM 96077]|uniref:2-oxoisovalerate dehydrogenase subunit alpha n=1 Tax=Phytoactinopolyspora halophila TaxID=1981511 RepID=A0A329R2E8_9ACTN|nr:thiamine pyrophosphate-dependent enzyme [Phytoactinopolyspora halophila]AYY15189.1 pyruvate dehydrogenase (acetyl-transferring) E1 component subunit alpha [Actinobacteria bacterium YIM 96077]RAW18139.1 pyruvate dehydrogenase (acetyl-transferring) E1 component subunit alpha [Phytoactinopolyspora halophila]
MRTSADHHETSTTRLLPSPVPVRFLDEDGRLGPEDERGGFAIPTDEALLETYRWMAIGRRFDTEASALARQGRLAVYPSSRGQEACQVGGVLALGSEDWLFPTYRDTVSLVVRGIDPVESLSLLRGEWHCGYDPVASRVAPQCTPLATHLPHAVGVAWAARRRGEDVVAMAFVGDGGTSEGDFHEALNFAAVFGVPVVFLVQNNRWAISVPLEIQTHAPSLASKGVGYGVRGEWVDGNDAVAVTAMLADAVRYARAERAPVLVEALTYRMAAHTNADDDRRYREASEVDVWQRRDPVSRLESYLVNTGALVQDDIDAVAKESESLAERIRDGLAGDVREGADDVFAHVYAHPPERLMRQRADVLAAE